MYYCIFTCWHILKPTMNNRPNTQLKWKLIYSSIHRAYLEPPATHFSDRRRNKIGLEIGTERLDDETNFFG